MKYAIIMAGGAGTRFWPLSTEDKPKQFLDILGTGKTFIQMTVDRFEGWLPKENIYILTNEKYRGLIHQQLPGLNDENIICEPSRNNTAPCILLAALKIRKKDPDACCLFVPSDQLIVDLEAFRKNARQALEYAASDQAIVTIGILPTRPETGYGYIKMKEGEHSELKKVEQFVEKPSLDTARLYLASGKYLWNAGMFAWHVNTIVQEYQNHVPRLFELLSGGIPVYNTIEENAFLARVYPSSENVSVDFAIMEKSEIVYTIPAAFDWSDLGIWSSVYEASEKDLFGNVCTSGRVYYQDANNNLVTLPLDKQALIRGLEDFIIIDSGDALLIYPRNQEHEIKKSLGALNS